MTRGRAGSSGTRSGYWSENKFTNLTQYCPDYSEADKIIKQHYTSLMEGKEIIFHQYEVAPGMYQPLNIDDMKQFLEKIPAVFLKDLRGIFICAGSRKQKKQLATIFGCYYGLYKCIFIFPFHNEELCFYYKYKPKPSISMEYERHGARWEYNNGLWKLKFDKHSLKSFYLRDVLTHEIGHHVDNIASLKSDSNTNEKEQFAEWFAMEFGVKGINKEKSEFGKVLELIIQRV